MDARHRLALLNVQLGRYWSLPLRQIPWMSLCDSGLMCTWQNNPLHLYLDRSNTTAIRPPQILVGRSPSPWIWKCKDKDWLVAWTTMKCKLLLEENPLLTRFSSWCRYVFEPGYRFRWVQHSWLAAFNEREMANSFAYIQSTSDSWLVEYQELCQSEPSLGLHSQHCAPLGQLAGTQNTREHTLNWKCLLQQYTVDYLPLTLPDWAIHVHWLDFQSAVAYYNILSKQMIVLQICTCHCKRLILLWDWDVVRSFILATCFRWCAAQMLW